MSFVALAIREHSSHRSCLRIFDEGTASMALTAQVLAEFCYVVTDPRRFERPLETVNAVELCSVWWQGCDSPPPTTGRA